MVKYLKPKNGSLPPLDARPGSGQTVSTLIVAITGMVNGSHGDVRTGPHDGDYVHVSRLKNGWWRAVHVSRLESFQTDNTLRLAQFIMNRVE